VVEQVINVLSDTDKHLLSLGISLAADVLTRSSDREWLKRKADMFKELLKDNWFLQEIRVLPSCIHRRGHGPSLLLERMVYLVC